jgi:hypothetical protein
MKDKDAPMTQGQFQILHDLMKKVDRNVDNFQNDMSQMKRDINTLAKGVDYERDTKGQLRKVG